MQDSQEILLTSEEIIEIQKYVLGKPFLKDPNVLNIISNDFKTVWRVTPINELILIKGNEHTGFNHIHRRHEFWSTTPFWNEQLDENGIPLNTPQDPSRFSRNSIPIITYPEIAESIYSIENKKIKENKRADIFDLYIGIHKDKEGVNAKYKLLLYKNTKIIHTLYPTSDKHNLKKQKKFPLIRGEVEVNQTLDKSRVELYIPFIDNLQKVKYSINIRKMMIEEIEDCCIFIHNENGKPYSHVDLGKQKLKEFKSIGHLKVSWQHADLRGFERIIIKLISQENNKNDH